MYKRVIWWALTLGAAWVGYWLGRELERQHAEARAKRIETLIHGTGGVINE